MNDRDWTQAINKMRDEDNTCRKCGSRNQVQCAHVTGRVADRKPTVGWALNGGGEWPKPWVVAPVRIVPLCKGCHDLYDAHDLDLLPYLDVFEVMQAVYDCAAGRSNGFATAWQRLTGEKLAA